MRFTGGSAQPPCDVRIHTIGGYEEVGKNMTAVEVDGDIVIIDMGADMEPVVEAEESVEQMETMEAVSRGIAPDDSQLFDRRDDVVGIVVTHGHLDHCLAVPKLAVAYDCPIYATPYTMRVVKRLVEQDVQWLNNDYEVVGVGDTATITSDIDIEFVNATHSIPDAALTVLHTPDGPVVCSTDFRLDDSPAIGDPPDYDRIRELGAEGVHAYIAESTRVDQSGRSRSEADVADELEQVFDRAHNAGENLIVSTFSSHIGRLNSILEANQTNRKVALLGRSLKEYTEDAARLDMINLQGVTVKSSYEEIDEFLHRIDPRYWLIICTGHQGEENAVLTRISEGDHHYPLATARVVFSSSVIPTPINEANRQGLERRLEARGASIERDVHAHGHAMREEHLDMLRMLNPDHLVPAHGTREKIESHAELATEHGYTRGDDLHLSVNGDTVEL